jgi:hypothetical protein
MTAIANHPHRVTTAIAGVRSELSAVADAAVWSMDAVETTNALTELHAAKAQLAELEARLLVHADHSEITSGNATSTANWYARDHHHDAAAGTPGHADRAGPRGP